jgi:hypothetical protein
MEILELGGLSGFEMVKSLQQAKVYLTLFTAILE